MNTVKTLKCSWCNSNNNFTEYLHPHILHYFAYFKCWYCNKKNEGVPLHKRPGNGKCQCEKCS